MRRGFSPLGPVAVAIAIAVMVSAAAAPADAHDLAVAVVRVSTEASANASTSTRLRLNVRETLGEATATDAAVSLTIPAECTALVPPSRHRNGRIVETAIWVGCAPSAGGFVFAVDRKGRAVEVLASIDGETGIAGELVNVDSTVVVWPGRTTAHRALAAQQGHASLIWVGALHVFSGWDHLLFLFALIVVVRGHKALLITITAFTGGHSLALLGATFWPPPLATPWIEFVIAASIAALVAEGLSARSGVATRMPWWIALGFGGVHGLGFANVWADLRPMGTNLVWEVLQFNVGVEVAQLVVAGVFLAIAPLGRFRPLMVCVGSVAVFMACDRFTEMFVS